MRTTLEEAMRQVEAARLAASKGAAWKYAGRAGLLAGVLVHSYASHPTVPDLDRLEKDVRAALGAQ